METAESGVCQDDAEAAGVWGGVQGQGGFGGGPGGQDDGPIGQRGLRTRRGGRWAERSRACWTTGEPAAWQRTGRGSGHRQRVERDTTSIIDRRHATSHAATDGRKRGPA